MLQKSMDYLRKILKNRVEGKREIFIQEPVGFWTTQRDGEVLLRMDNHGFGKEVPFTVHELMLETTTRFPNSIALATRQEHDWETITYIEFYEVCRKAAKSFLKLGLERFHGVGILGHNSIEWLIAELAAIFAGGIAVGIFPTNSSQACRFIAENSEANVLVVENDWQLQKILQIKDHLNHLKAIVQYKDRVKKKLPNLYTWQEFLALGLDVKDEELDKIIDSQKPNQCCMLIYTSGTTGPPKAVMLSHDNITWTTSSVLHTLPYNYPPDNQEILVSYLPFSLIIAQIFEVWIPISIAASLFFAESDALKVQGSLIKTLREVRPTTFCAVPHIWDEIQEKLTSDQVLSSTFKKAMIDWAKKVGLKENIRRMSENTQNSVSFRVAKKLVYAKVHQSLGLDRCLKFLCSGSGLSKETQQFFLSIDMPLYQMYGMTECTGPHSLSNHTNFKLFSCGKSIPGSQNKIQEEDGEGMGEFYLWGRHLSMGYLNNEFKTKKIFDNKGWLRSGDLGTVDDQGSIRINGRIEEIIINNQGEKILPGPIEELLKKAIPIVRHAMIVGNYSKFLSVLLTLKCEINENTGEPRTTLTPEAINYCRKNNSRSTKVTEITNNQDPLIDAIIQKGIDEVNEKAPSESYKILKWKVLEKDFSIVGGELGPTMKLRRSHVFKAYQTIISGFYN